jgi:hypothetical protein
MSSSKASAGVLHILKKLKQSLKARGAKGLVGLSRKFRIMDDDGSNSLNLAEVRPSHTLKEFSKCPISPPLLTLLTDGGALLTV